MVEIKEIDELPLITYNSLYNILREEKRNKEKLYKLPEKYYEAVKKFLNEKEKEIKNIDKNDKIKLKKELRILNNSKKITNEILILRSFKISKLAIENELFEENFDFKIEKEKIFYEKIKKLFKDFKK